MSGELASLREQSQFRALEILHGINLCSNDYLGLARRPEFKRAVLDAVARADSMGSTGSRLLSGNSREWEELESEFARFAGTEAALYFGSGYAANVGLLSSVLKPGDVVFSDACNHASLIDGIRLSGRAKIIYPHLDLEFLEKALDENSCTGAKLIVTESVFSMEGDFAPLEDLVRLARANGAELVIDEAHAVGACGRQGRGFAAHCGIERDALAIVHTCGKALASAGAFVCGGNVLKEFLINRARTFIFSTAMPPYLAGQIRAALEFVAAADAERAHLAAIWLRFCARGWLPAVCARERAPATSSRCFSAATKPLCMSPRNYKQVVCGEGDSPADGTCRHGAHSPFAHQQDYSRRRAPARFRDRRSR